MPGLLGHGDQLWARLVQPIAWPGDLAQPGGKIGDDSVHGVALQEAAEGLADPVQSTRWYQGPSFHRL
jgi:hypothetical protein